MSSFFFKQLVCLFILSHPECQKKEILVYCLEVNKKVSQILVNKLELVVLTRFIEVLILLFIFSFTCSCSGHINNNVTLFLCNELHNGTVLVGFI